MIEHDVSRSGRTPVAPLRRSHAVADSPVGPLTLVAVGGAVTGLYMDEQRHRPPQEVFGTGGRSGRQPFAEAFRQLQEYFDGQRTEFDLRLSLDGTAFQQRVWAALRAIPYGQTVSYGQLADRLGQPTASGPSAWPTGRTRSASSCRATAWSARTAASPATAAGSSASAYLLGHELRVSGQTLA